MMRSLLGVFLLSCLCFCGCAARPMLVTPETSNEYNEGYKQGGIDAQGNAAWSLAGFGCGVIGIGAAYTYSPNPPTQALEGRSTEYTVAYMEAYKAVSREKNTHHAIMGMVVSIAVYVLFVTYELSVTIHQ